MNSWRIAAILIAVLLLAGGVGAVKPVKEPVDKVVLIHYKDGVAAKPAPVLDAASFKLLGVKWKMFPVHYSVDPSNDDVAGTDAVTASVTDSFATWDAATFRDLFQYGGSSMMGSQVAPNGENLVFWASMGEANSNIIAMTTIWYTRKTKEIVETDIQMNDDMAWGIDPDGEGPKLLSGAYDIQNIATHEAGHVCGLADLYGPRDTELTMYGYGSLGEVRKISLASGDIAGLVKLYGA